MHHFACTGHIALGQQGTQGRQQIEVEALVPHEEKPLSIEGVG